MTSVIPRASILDPQCPIFDPRLAGIRVEPSYPKVYRIYSLQLVTL